MKLEKQFKQSIGRQGGLFRHLGRAIASAAFLFFGTVTAVGAAPVSNIAATKHNLSKNGSFTVKASTETEICAFCHTPHGANNTALTPLWNRSGSGNTYTRYTSSSLDANNITDGFNNQPAGSSLMCLSCHDGTVALGNVRVLRGQQNVSITMAAGTTNTGGANPGGGAAMVAGGMPVGGGADTGFTRLLGTDLTNDHPISITYNSALANADGEMRPMTAQQQDSDTNGTILGIRKSGYKPLLPLHPTGNNGLGQVQCATCHDPHLYDASDPKRKFLRVNRLQAATPGGGTFSQSNDIICLACHTKAGTAWSQSVHANSTTASPTYTATAATLREFPATTQVWQAACLNCHDTHTVAGARRLLREGTDGALSAGGAKQGGKSAIEETCFQCHTASIATTINGVSTPGSALNLPTPRLTATTGVPDIWTEFQRAVRMPIKTNDQGGGGNTTEVHDITNADFVETPGNLGLGVNGNRHAECTDCHNPHRVIRNERYDAAGTIGQRTHVVGGTAANLGADGNTASGVLRGIWGVEPTYPTSSTTWPQTPTQYTQKKGIPGAAGADPLTKEYQLCLKCHSDYSNIAGQFPQFRGASYGGTPSGTNGMTSYTNVAAEFGVNATNPPSTGLDQGENGNDPAYTPGNPNGAPDGAPTNHRSWHPVIFPTGRTRYERTNNSTAAYTTASTQFTNIRAPFNIDNRIGKQTMHCSDCHGEVSSWTVGTGPDLTKTQGPHGATNNFLLKGQWDITLTITAATGGSPTAVCGRCHNPSGSGGFSQGDAGHTTNSDHQQLARCQFCHVSLPHGWKNKAFLANLNCVGPEAGKPAGCTNNAVGNTAQLWKAPYYNGALLRIATWRASTTWTETSCGAPGNTGQNWMDSACQNAKTTQQAQSY